MGITAGEGNGWQFSEEALRESLDLWEGTETFIDHGGMWGGRSVRDLAGVCTGVSFDESMKGIRMKLKPFGPSGKLLEAIGEEWLGQDGVKPNIGFSADLLFSGKGKEVRKILRIFSVDLVYRPARGGVFLRALNSMYSQNPLFESEQFHEEKIEMEEEKEVVKELESEQDDSQAELLQAMQETLLETKLSAANLPAALANQVRKQFSGKTFKAAELDTSIQEARELLASLQGGGIIQGSGKITSMVNERDRIQAAADDLMGAAREKGMDGVQVAKLTGIRELYTTLTGDVELQGRMFPERVMLADFDSVANVLKNAFNKIMVEQWASVGTCRLPLVGEGCHG